MTATIACIVVASRKRGELLDTLILPSILSQGFDEVVVVGDYHSDKGYRHIPFCPVFGTTVDAQFKRDLGTMVTTSDTIVYLCDDHRLEPAFGASLRGALLSLDDRVIVVPGRFTMRDGEKIGLNAGWPGYAGLAYCGGHCGVFPRRAIQEVPWCVAPWHPNWDYFHSRMLVKRGYHLLFTDQFGVEDVEPGAEPWR